MMYPRLMLLQRLLADDGAIFISIDNTEEANLRLICDEVFGSGNYINTILWQKKFSRANDALYLSEQHDFIILYAKNKEGWKRNLLPKTEELQSRFQNPDNDPRGAWQSVSYNCNKNADERPSLYYPITNPKTGEEVMPSRNRVWTYSKERHEENMKNNLVYWGADGKGLPRLKKFANDTSGMVPTTWWDYQFAGENQTARKEFRKIFGEEIDFSTPKPTSLIDRILQIATDHDSIILDSFAGSGTTAHAVLNMNKADGGNRRFILIEMMDYSESITAERVRRVIDGYGDDKNAVEGAGGGFDYYELGEPLMFANGTLNEAVGAEKIREYVWYTETRTAYSPRTDKYFLGEHSGAAYYFCYEKDEPTTLDLDSLRLIKVKAEQYVIYADICALSAADLKRNGIIFKKIPRDIKKF